MSDQPPSERFRERIDRLRGPRGKAEITNMDVVRAVNDLAAESVARAEPGNTEPIEAAITAISEEVHPIGRRRAREMVREALPEDGRVRDFRRFNKPPASDEDEREEMAA